MRINHRDYKKHPVTDLEIKKLSVDGVNYSRKVMKDFIKLAKALDKLPSKSKTQYKSMSDKNGDVICGTNEFWNRLKRKSK
jgi:hypothetical protein